LIATMVLVILVVTPVVDVGASVCW
jgi:hypothetical protein